MAAGKVHLRIEEYAINGVTSGMHKVHLWIGSLDEVGFNTIRCSGVAGNQIAFIC